MNLPMRMESKHHPWFLCPNPSLGFRCRSLLRPNLSLGFRCRGLLCPNLSLGFRCRSLLRPNLSLGFCCRSLPCPNVAATFRCRRLRCPNVATTFHSRRLQCPNVVATFCTTRPHKTLFIVSKSAPLRSPLLLVSPSPCLDKAPRAAAAGRRRVPSTRNGVSDFMARARLVEIRLRN